MVEAPVQVEHGPDECAQHGEPSDSGGAAGRGEADEGGAGLGAPPSNGEVADDTPDQKEVEIFHLIAPRVDRRAFDEDFDRDTVEDITPTPAEG